MNVSSKLDSICTVLPCLPSHSELVPSASLSTRSLHVRLCNPRDHDECIEVVVKANNPLYADVIHDDWLDQSLDNDADFCAILLQQPDVEPMDTVSSTNQSPKQIDGADD